ncbi:MAG: alanine--tRNA ligase [Oscillospiraceae bacterium]|nr:alanine--tRNA ligase [Oscillospiraceae bacterium]
MAHPYRGLNELREMFLTYFESKDHLRLPSFPLIPQNDPSLLLIPAGMAPMKPWFKGEEEPPRKRVCTCQKCIRTPDIDNIGKTDRHGTYFEMLGNFSFGDFFKKEAIAYCWEFLTDVVGLEADRLYPSVYEQDDEAFEIWNKDIGIAPERIFRFGKADNFWEHGAGPCGPCSEVYYDRGEEFGCGKDSCTVGCDCDRYIEVWNNVFSQFDNDGQNNYTELKQKNIDTGMGLERLACVCQNVGSLFEVDTVMNVTNKVSEIVGVKYHEDAEKDISLRIITDHIRSSTMMICDGVLPSNEGRGYVLRRLLRRAARHGKLLGVNRPFLYEIVDTVVAVNECEYKDLREKEDYIVKVIRTEEENFAKTIDGGMKIFAEMLSEHKKNGESVFSGADAFKLYDTYGFPIDLTAEMVKEENMSVDEEGFRALMQEQKVRAREARKAMGDLGWSGIDFGKEVPATVFDGYAAENLKDYSAKVVAIVAEDELRDSVVSGVSAILVLDKTPFYAEMGGQAADHGVITTAEGASFAVNNVQKNAGGKYMHYGVVTAGELKVGCEVSASVDTDRRSAIMRAHSATHMLDAALREVLGDHAHQAGSLVEPDRLRYDFTHFAGLTAEEIKEVSRRVNEMILAGLEVEVREMPIDEAKKMGAVALFGEKYGDIVRVVNMEGRSIEFCGGTHLTNTAKAGAFRIVSEGSVASGVRRIEAVTGQAVLDLVDEMDKKLASLAEVLKTTPAELFVKAENTVKEVKELQQTIDRMKDKVFAGEVEQLLSSAKDVNGLKVVTSSRGSVEANDLRKMGDFLRDKDENVVAVLAAANGEKVTLLAVCGKAAIAKGIKAGDIIKNIAPVVGGKGGGKPDSAMGGGSEVGKIDAALAAAEEYAAANVK